MENEKQKHLEYLNAEIARNSEDYYNGSLSYEELHSIQNPLIKERNELLES